MGHLSRRSIILGGNRYNVYGGIYPGVIVWGAIAPGRNVRWGGVLGSNCPGSNCLGRNCPGSICPGLDCRVPSKVIDKHTFYESHC